MKCAVVCVAKIWTLTEKELGATIIIFTLKCGNNTFTMSSLRRYFRFQKHPHIKRAWTHNSSEELKQPEKKGNFFWCYCGFVLLFDMLCSDIAVEVVLKMWFG